MRLRARERVSVPNQYSNNTRCASYHPHGHQAPIPYLCRQSKVLLCSGVKVEKTGMQDVAQSDCADGKRHKDLRAVPIYYGSGARELIFLSDRVESARRGSECFQRRISSNYMYGRAGSSIMYVSNDER